MATAKLTLAIEEEVVEKMKDYASSRSSSVSRIVENYFIVLTNQSPKAKERIAVSPFVKGLSIKSMGLELPSDFNPEEEAIRNMEEKYR